MISWKLWIYLDHFRWGSEGKYTISDFEWWAILFIAIGARFSVCAPTVDHFISHRTWWFVWLRCASYYNDERSSSRKSQCAKQLYAQVLFYYGDQTLNLTSFVGCTKQLIHQLPLAVDVEIMTTFHDRNVTLFTSNCGGDVSQQEESCSNYYCKLNVQ